MKKLLCLVGGAVTANVEQRDRISRNQYNSDVVVGRLLCCLLLSIVFFCAKAQSGTGLRVGDRLPDFKVMHIVGHPLNAVNISGVNKPMILDFFATSCSGCIGLLPHLDKLQRAYGDSIKIIVVTKESASSIKKFLKTNSLVKNIDLTFIVEDSILNGLIKHRTIPHEAWIANDLTIKAISRASYLNKKNIDVFVNSEGIDLPLKDDYIKFDIHKGLDKYALVNRIYLKSIVTGYIDNAPSGYSGSFICSDGLHENLYFVNFQPISFLLAVLKGQYQSNRILLNVSDSSLFFKPKGSDVDWGTQNSYCYSLIVPVNMPDSVRLKKALADFSSKLGLNIELGKRDVPCYELVKQGVQIISPDTKGGSPISTYYPQKGHPVILRNSPLSQFIKVLNNGSGGKDNPIVLSSLKDKNIDLNLAVANLADIKSVNIALKPYGLHLRKTHKLLDMILISDK